MLVQKAQTDSLFASGIFSVSGEKMQNKAGNVMSFSSLFDSMTARQSLNVPNVNLKLSDQKNAADLTKKADLTGNEKPQTVSDVKIQDVTNADDAEDIRDAVKELIKGNGAEEPDTAEFEKVSTCLVQVVVTVVEFFEITPEELQVQLDKLGMSFSDLADPDNLKDLFVSLNCNGDISMLLTDQNLLDSFDKLMNEVTKVLEDLGVDKDMISDMFKGTLLDEKSLVRDLLKNAGVSGKDNENTGVKADEQDAGALNASAATDEKEITIEFSKDKGEASGKDGERSDKKKNDVSVKTDRELADKFIDNMVERFRQNVNEVSGLDRGVPNIRNVAFQILDQIRVNITEDIRNLEIQLTPEHLGKVNVQIQENDGVISAKFRTENQITKEAIESNLIQFKETLREQGLKVDHIEVTVSDFSFAKDQDTERNNMNQNGNKNKRHFSLDEVNEKAEAADLKAQSYIDDGTSTVTYVA